MQAAVGRAGETFDPPIETFAKMCADQNQRDFDEVLGAVKSGVLDAHEDSRS